MQIQYRIARFIIDDNDKIRIVCAECINAVNLSGHDNFQSIFQCKLQGFPGIFPLAESLFYSSRMKIRCLIEITQPVHRPDEDLDQPSPDLDKIRIGHENVILYLRRQFLYNRRTQWSYFLILQMLPLPSFCQQFFSYTAQCLMNEHTQVRC